MLLEVMKNFSILLIMFFLLLRLLKKTNYDFSSPCVISLTLLTISFFAYILGVNLWKNSLKMNTIFVLIVGFIIIFSAGYFGRNKRMRIDTKFIPSYFKIQLISFVCLLLTCLYTFEIYRIGHEFNIGFMKAISFTKENGYLMNVIIRQGFKVVMMNAYLSTFLMWCVPNNFNKKKGYLCFLTLNILLAIFISVVSGSRGDILKVFSCLFLFYFVLKRPTKKQVKKLLTISVPLLFVFSIIFFFSKNAVKGFSDSMNELNYVEYILFYLGSPVEVLNIKLGNLNQFSTGLFGYRNFINIYGVLTKIGIISETVIPTVNEFVYIGNFNFGGNVGTAYFDFISDFGYLLGLLFIFIIFMLGMSLYRKNKTVYSAIVFGYFYNFYVFFFYSSTISYFLSMNALFNLIVLSGIYLIYFKIKI